MHLIQKDFKRGKLAREEGERERGGVCEKKGISKNVFTEKPVAFLP